MSRPLTKLNNLLYRNGEENSRNLSKFLKALSFSYKKGLDEFLEDLMYVIRGTTCIGSGDFTKQVMDLHTIIVFSQRYDEALEITKANQSSAQINQTEILGTQNNFFKNKPEQPEHISVDRQSGPVCLPKFP